MQRCPVTKQDVSETSNLVSWVPLGEEYITEMPQHCLTFRSDLRANLALNLQTQIARRWVNPPAKICFGRLCAQICIGSACSTHLAEARLTE